MGRSTKDFCESTRRCTDAASKQGYVIVIVTTGGGGASGQGMVYLHKDKFQARGKQNPRHVIVLEFHSSSSSLRGGSKRSKNLVDWRANEGILVLLALETTVFSSQPRRRLMKKKNQDIVVWNDNKAQQ